MHTCRVWGDHVSFLPAVATEGSARVKELWFCSENNLRSDNQHMVSSQANTSIHMGIQKKWTITEYFLIRKESTKQVKDVKVVRDAEVESDHHLALMKLAIRKKMMYKKLLHVGTGEARQRYNEAKTEARTAIRKAKK